MATAPSYANGFFKHNYVDEELRDETFKDAPLLRLVQKKANSMKLYGDVHAWPVNYTPAGGASADFPTAWNQALVNNDTTVQFQIPPITYSSVQIMDSVTFLQSAQEVGAFIELLEKRSNDAIAWMVQRLAREVYAGGFGNIGTIASINGAFATLTNPADSVNFYPGMYVDAAQFAGTGATRSRNSGITSTGFQITGVNQVAGVLTGSAAWTDGTNGISGVSAGDTLFPAGDRQNASSPVAQVIVGLEGWCPAGGVTNVNDSFYNVNRSVSAQLYGTSFDGTGGSQIMQIIQDASTRSYQLLQGKQTHYFMCPAAYNRLAKQLQSFYRYTTPADMRSPGVGPNYVGADDRIELPGIDIETPGGTVRCVSDPFCPANRIWGVNEDDLELLILNDGFAPWTLDGNEFLRVSGQSKLELRFEGYHNLAIKRPKNLVNIQTQTFSV